LQAAFKKNNIKKVIDVEKLVKAKYQDNLEMCQWMKKYYDLHYNGAEYDPLARRPEGTEVYYIAGGSKVNPLKKPAGTASNTNPPLSARTRPQTAQAKPSQPKPSTIAT
jgi:RP/EB family microtubule-associated protein